MANDAGQGRFCWFDLAAADPAAAIKFYSRIFNWKTFEKGGMTMWESPAGAVGSLAPLPAEESGGAWLPYVAVADVEATLARARQLGGEVKTPATATGMGGWFAHLKDPQGAAIGVYAPADVPHSKAQVGQFSWVELMTSDAPAAAAFYFELFGWQETSSVDMGALGRYQMFGRHGVPYGGLYNPGPSPAGPQWISYVRVPDVAALAAAAKAAGARVLNGPMEVPGGDWIVQLMDPQGVMIAAHELSETIVAKPAAGRAKPRPQPAPAKKKTAAKKKVAKKKAAKKAPPRPKSKPRVAVKAKAKVKVKVKAKAKAKAKPKSRPRLQARPKTKRKAQGRAKGKARAAPKSKTAAKRTPRRKK